MPSVQNSFTKRSKIVQYYPIDTIRAFDIFGGGRGLPGNGRQSYQPMFLEPGGLLKLPFPEPESSNSQVAQFAYGYLYFTLNDSFHDLFEYFKLEIPSKSMMTQDHRLAIIFHKTWLLQNRGLVKDPGWSGWVASCVPDLHFHPHLTPDCG